MSCHPVHLRPVLLRMVTDGLRHTIDAYLVGTLPLHRLAWELRARLQPLAELTDLRTLNRLHGHTVTVERLRDQLAAGDSATGLMPAATRPDELTRDLLTAALGAFRATLDALTHTPSPTPTRSRRRPTSAA